MADDLDSILDKADGTAAPAPAPQAAPQAAPAAKPAAAPDPNDLDAALNAADPGAAARDQAAQPSTFDSLWSKAKNVAQGSLDATKAIGRGLAQANSAVANAMVHPLDTARSIGNAIAHPIQGTSGAREFMRGVNDNIPFANTVVEKIGGPAAESPEDASVAPGVRQVGGLVGAPVGGEMVGGLAAKGLETLAPAASSFVRSFGAAAKERQVGRAMEDLETGARQRARLGLDVDSGEGAARAVVEANPAVRKAVGHDETLLRATKAVKKDAQETLAPIHAKSGPADEAAAKAVGNVDERIAKLAKGDVNDRAAAVKLQKLRDEFNNTFGSRDTVSAAELRSEQSAYQKNGYAKNLEEDPDVAAGILAQREMSKAVGDAVVQHVTGMDYAAAKAAAEADPHSLAARIFKANEQIEGANKIEATVADRLKAGKPAEPHGIGGFVKGVAGHAAKHAALPMIIGATTHSPLAALGAAAATETAQALPAIVRGAGAAKDAMTVGAAGRAANVLDAAGRTAGAYGRALEIPRDAALAKKIQELMKRGIPQATAVQIARGVPGAASAFEPTMAENPDAQPIVL